MKLLIPILLLAATACRDREEPSAARLVDPHVAAAANTAPEDVPPPPPAVAPPTDDPDYVPAEHKTGASRWKDTIVYVDGKPRGALTFGEMPIPLEPTWVDEQKPAEIRSGSKDPGYTWVKKRRYKFSDYVRAIGIDPKKVKEIHVYGPKFTDSIIATGKQMMSKAGNEFLFRFASEVGGKAQPHAPENFGNGRSPDKISSVMIYVNRKPPKLVPNDGFYLDGEKVHGVPYYGEPLRGGVRVYLDNALVAVIKRQELKPELAEKLADGTLRWKLHDFLKGAGIDDTGVTQAWIIRNERRTEMLSMAELTEATFEAASQAHGEVLVGKDKHRAQAIALHTKPLTQADLPVILEDEE